MGWILFDMMAEQAGSKDTAFLQAYVPGAEKKSEAVSSSPADAKSKADKTAAAQ